MENGASQYSKPWRAVKYRPKITVMRRAVFAWERLDSTRLWWDQVRVIPDASSRAVLRRGT